MLKQDWERRTKPFPLTQCQFEQICLKNKLALINGFEFISLGCANSNYLIKSESTHFILRIYNRDSQAIYREQKLAKLLAPEIPMANILAIDDSGEIINANYAIIHFVEGELFRTRLLQSESKALTILAKQAGFYLARIHQHEYKTQGFLNQNLSVESELNAKTYFDYLQSLLVMDKVKQLLGHHYQSLVNFIMTNQALLTISSKPTLTHGDFDSANILVAPKKSGWEITAILDWEFAFAGNIYFDIGNMLRYSHLLPASFCNCFFQGLQSGGLMLTDEVMLRAKYFDLISLLDLITQNSDVPRVKMERDIRNLILNTIT